MMLLSDSLIAICWALSDFLPFDPENEEVGDVKATERTRH